MSTNFFTVRGLHIGKRLAAGQYCYDCNVTLCKGGNAMVHSSPRVPLTGDNEKEWIAAQQRYHDEMWHKVCPMCGKAPVDENLENSSGGKELGFNKNVPTRKRGVRSCASFTWGIDPEVYRLSHILVVKDEYGRKYSRAHFDAILRYECPIQFTNCVGVEFS